MEMKNESPCFEDGSSARKQSKKRPRPEASLDPDEENIIERFFFRTKSCAKRPFLRHLSSRAANPAHIKLLMSIEKMQIQNNLLNDENDKREDASFENDLYLRFIDSFENIKSIITNTHTTSPARGLSPPVDTSRGDNERAVSPSPNNRVGSSCYAFSPAPSLDAIVLVEQIAQLRSYYELKKQNETISLCKSLDEYVNKQITDLRESLSLKDKKELAHSTDTNIVMETTTMTWKLDLLLKMQYLLSLLKGFSSIKK